MADDHRRQAATLAPPTVQPDASADAETIQPPQLGSESAADADAETIQPPQLGSESAADASRTSLGRFAAVGFAQYRERFPQVIGTVRTSRAAWSFATVWVAAALALVLTGQGFPLDGLLKAAVFLLLSLLTIMLTCPAPAVRSSTAQQPRVWLQLCLIALFIVLTAWRGLIFHHAAPTDAAVPIWSPVVDALGRLGDQWFGNGNYVANPVTYAVMPLLVLLLAGARLRSLGFGPGHRVVRVLVLWCALPVLAFAYALLAGQLALGRLAALLLSNALNNGFFEEFLFRGALQTRLRQLMAPGRALVFQALIFGAWHLGLGFTDTGHAGFLPALASTIVNQAVIGLAYGIVFERTRNLLAPSIIHVVFNTL